MKLFISFILIYHFQMPFYWYFIALILQAVIWSFNEMNLDTKRN